MTNGEKIRETFPNAEISYGLRGVVAVTFIHKTIFDLDWWNAEYKEPKGHWIKEKSVHGWDGRSYQCSVCGRSIHLDTEVESLIDYPYCHCGSRNVR